MSCHSAISCFSVRMRKYDRYTEDKIKILPYMGSGNWVVLAAYDWNWELTVKTEQELGKKAWRNTVFFLCKLSLFGFK